MDLVAMAMAMKTVLDICTQRMSELRRRMDLTAKGRWCWSMASGYQPASLVDKS